MINTRHQYQTYSQTRLQALYNRVISGRLKARLIWLFHKWAERQLRNKGTLEFLRSRPPGAFSPNYSDLWFLYRTTRRRKPTCVLEFGSGCSTVILAQALLDNKRKSSANGGMLYSVDVDRDWAEVTKQSMAEDLAGLYEISYSAVIESDFEGTPAWRHEKYPDVVPDLMYLDGPPLTDERPVAVDVLDIEHRLNPGCCLIVDGRIENVRFLRENLKRQWKFKHRWFFRNSVFELVA